MSRVPCFSAALRLAGLFPFFRRPAARPSALCRPCAPGCPGSGAFRLLSFCVFGCAPFVFFRLVSLSVCVALPLLFVWLCVILRVWLVGRRGGARFPVFRVGGGCGSFFPLARSFGPRFGFCRSSCRGACRASGLSLGCWMSSFWPGFLPCVACFPLALVSACAPRRLALLPPPLFPVPLGVGCRGFRALLRLGRCAWPVCPLFFAAGLLSRCAWFPRRVPGGFSRRLVGGVLVAPVVGFSGSRSAAPSVCAAVAAVVRALPSSAFVWAGCASGVDQAASASAPSVSRLRVFRAAGSAPAALVARSVSFVRALAAAPGACLLSWPCAPCPAGVRPSASASACFCGSGSGSWASAALAVGLGVSVVVFGVCPPACWRPRAVVVFGAPGWLCRPVRVPVCLSLF